MNIELVSYDIQFTHVAPNQSVNVQWMLYEFLMLFSKIQLRVGLQVKIANASLSSDKSFQL